MLGNFNTLIFFRVQDEATAKILIEKQRKVNVGHVLTYSGATDSSDVHSDVHFISSTQSREQRQQMEMLTVTDLTKLPKGQFFMIMNGNQLYKGRVPWLIPARGETVPENIRQVAEQMRHNYSSRIPDWYSYRDYFKPQEVLRDENGADQWQAVREQLRGWGEDSDVQFGSGLGQDQMEADDTALEDGFDD